MFESTISAFIANVLSDLTSRLVEHAPRKWRRRLKGDKEQRQALEDCLSAGLLMMLSKVSDATTMQQYRLQKVFGDFFAHEAVSDEVAQLLRGNPLDHEKLAEIFYEVGYDETTLPGSDFTQAITLFEVGFRIAASQEPLFQAHIQTTQLLEQTNIQRELLNQIDELVTNLRQVGHNHAQIGAGVVTINHPQLGQQQFLLPTPPDNHIYPAPKLRQAYLDYLFTTLRKLSLSGIDRQEASDAKAQLQLDGVYTALLTQSSERHQRERLPSRRLGREERLSVLAQLNQHPR